MSVTFTSDGRFPEGLAAANFSDGIPIKKVDLQTALYPLGVAFLRLSYF